MRTPTLVPTAALALVGLLGAPAGAVDLPPAEVYLHCPTGTTQVDVEPVAHGPVTWDARRPTGSLQSGGGCGFADVNPLRAVVTPRGTVRLGPETTVRMEGVVSGDLDSLTLRAYVVNAGSSRSSGTITLSLSGTVDGRSVFGTAFGQPAERYVPVTLAPTATAGVSLAEVTVTGLGRRTTTAPAAEHRVTLELGGVGDVLSRWSLDTAETPSSIVVDPRVPAAASVAAVPSSAPKA